MAIDAIEKDKQAFPPFSEQYAKLTDEQNILRDMIRRNES